MTRYRKRGSGNLQLEKSGWYAFRYRVNGVCMYASLKTKDRAEAEILAQQVLQGMLYKSEQVVYLEDVWEEFSKLSKNVDPEKLKSHKTIWDQFFDFIKKTFPFIMTINEVSALCVLRYIGLLNQKVSNNEFNVRIKFLRHVFRTIGKDIQMKHDIFDDLYLKQDMSALQCTTILNELNAVTAAAKLKKSNHWYLMIMMGIYTGLSLKDVINLKWSDIDLTQNTIKVVPHMSKRIFPIILTIHPKLRSLLLKIDDDYQDDKVLKGVVSKSASAITRILGSIFNEAYKELGRQLDTSKVPSEHFHDLRKKYVLLAMNKVSRQTISPFKGY